MMETKLLVKVEEAAAMLSIGKSTFWRLVRSGTLPQPIKIAGATRWRVQDLQNCISQPPANQPTTA